MSQRNSYFESFYAANCSANEGAYNKTEFDADRRTICSPDSRTVVGPVEFAVAKPDL